jgi:hypothetical protein
MRGENAKIENEDRAENSVKRPDCIKAHLLRTVRIRIAEK